MSAYDDLTFAPVHVVGVEGEHKGLFRPHKGRRLTAQDRRPGRIPFVGGSRMNNSVTDFADTPALFPGGWLTLIYNGDGGTGHARYQPAPFSASDDVIALEPLSGSATEPALLLIASMLTQQCVPKFGFGYKLTLHRLGRQKIMAPVTTVASGEQVVDWEGLGRLGEELLADAKTRARFVRTSTLPEASVLPALTFAPMLITDVCMSMRASSAWYDKSSLVLIGQATHPFVSRTRESNGIDGSCPRQEKNPEPENAITIGLDTQTVAYQPAAFYTSQNIQVLRHERLRDRQRTCLGHNHQAADEQVQLGGQRRDAWAPAQDSHHGAGENRCRCRRRAGRRLGRDEPLWTSTTRGGGALDECRAG